jgi:hypothetical protein
MAQQRGLRLVGIPARPVAFSSATPMGHSALGSQVRSLLDKRVGDAVTIAIVAAQRADECLAEGDVEGQQIWKATVDAILSVRPGSA